MSKLIHQELSGTIIGIAMEVLNGLKPGLDEKLYERAMVIGTRRRGDVGEAQREFPCFIASSLIEYAMSNSDLILFGKICAATSRTSSTTANAPSSRWRRRFRLTVRCAG
jgi:GxxExxY protein